MYLVGSAQQQRHDYLFDASGTITTGGTAQLVLPQATSRTMLVLQNVSDTAMYFEFGSARATCAITSGVVTSVSIANAGFNFTKPPVVRFYGGGGVNATGSATGAGAPFLGGNIPGYTSPSNVAQGHAVLSGATVGSITIDNGGSGYLIAPYVFMFNSDLDPYGCAVPSVGVGIELASGSAPLILNGTACTTDPIGVYCATTGKAFICKYML